jgi:hypothetical protein
LDALIVNAEIKGVSWLAENQLEWGVKYTRESIRDRVVEVVILLVFYKPNFDLPRNDQPLHTLGH